MNNRGISFFRVACFHGIIKASSLQFVHLIKTCKFTFCLIFNTHMHLVCLMNKQQSMRVVPWSYRINVYCPALILHSDWPSYLAVLYRWGIIGSRNGKCQVVLVNWGIGAQEEDGANAIGNDNTFLSKLVVENQSHFTSNGIRTFLIFINGGTIDIWFPGWVTLEN